MFGEGVGFNKAVAGWRGDQGFIKLWQVGGGSEFNKALAGCRGSRVL